MTSTNLQGCILINNLESKKLLREFAQILAEILAEELAAKLAAYIQPTAPAPANTSENDFYTPETLADYLKVSPPTIYKWVRLRAIPYQRVGKFVRFNKPDIEQWLSERAVQTNPKNEAKVIIKKRG